MPRLTVPPKQRLVRQQSLWSKVSAYPFDLWLSVSEDIQLVDWDAYAQPVGLPSGLGATIILWFCRLYVSGFRRKTVTSANSWKNWFRNSHTDDILVDFTPDHSGFASGIFKATSSFIAYFVSLISLILLAACLMNAVYCYTSTKHYTLMARSSDNPPDTPSARRVRYDSIQDDQLQSAGTPNENDTDENEGDLWSLDIWDPPKFNMFFFTTYSPLHYLIVWYAPISTLQLVLLIAVSGHLYILVHMFFILVKDKSVVHSEVLGEYGKKVVQPIIAVPRRDVCVGTDSDEVEVFTPARPTKLTMHSVRDRPVLAPPTWGSPVGSARVSRSPRSRPSAAPKPWSPNASRLSSPLPSSRSTSTDRLSSPLASRSRFIPSRSNLGPQ
ncbi:conserved fungal protein [Sugiyamaella lignohabitans]|uniref:Nuclear rim protein 1 n=1 Tax=Sugiyamaella lignohabitans TaxID=796027 RepID=A0A167D8V0_9ASCO|nr:uncharacterized protein AWJ20_882 [Sugiyamaella lignohabitans]ANB12623.1 conserved fungal protein [Sugiyamaella lignohabitans]